MAEVSPRRGLLDCQRQIHAVVRAALNQAVRWGLVGRNVAQYVFLFGGLVFLGAGMAMLALMQTGLNVLNYTVATCVVSFLIGLVMVTSGLYTRTGPPAQAKAVDEHRHAPPARPARQAGATA